jgi:hypothetical protein
MVHLYIEIISSEDGGWSIRIDDCIGPDGGTGGSFEDDASKCSRSSPSYFLLAPDRCEGIAPRIIASVEKQIQ